jgi:hypothetical protein
MEPAGSGATWTLAPHGVRLGRAESSRDIDHTIRWARVSEREANESIGRLRKHSRAGGGLACHAIASRLAVASCEGWLATAEGLRQWSSWEWTTWTGSPKGERLGKRESISAARMSGSSLCSFSLPPQHLNCSTTQLLNTRMSQKMSGSHASVSSFVIPSSFVIRASSFFRL